MERTQDQDSFAKTKKMTKKNEKKGVKGGVDKSGQDRMRVDYLLNGDNRKKSPSSIMKTSGVESSCKLPASKGSSSWDKSEKKKQRKYECSQCGFCFGMRSNLKRHVMTVHEDRREFRCRFCDAAFGLKQNLVTHIRVKHERKRPFVCEVCSYSFGYKQVLQNHRRNIHGLQ